MAKKIIAWLLVVTLSAGVAIGGTLAYLTDRDSEANVFTSGDVEIDLTEDFQQGAELVPGVEIKKEPTVTNEGPNDAWVWTTVAVPADLAEVVDFTGKGDGWKDWTKGDETVEINGKNYVLYTILHKDALAVGEETNPLFTTVALNSAVDIDPEGNWYAVEAGKAESLGWTNDDGNPVIYVSAYAIQTEGFASVEEAYAAYNTQWGNNGTEYPEAPNLLDTAEELWDAAMTSANHIVAEDIYLPSFARCQGEDVDTTINLNGHTVTVDTNIEASNSGLGFVVQQKANLVINGPGCVDMNYDGSENPAYCAPFLLSSNATVTVNGGTYLMGNTVKAYHIFCQNTARITINDGTFITSNPNAVIAYCINGYIDINGGFFQNTANSKMALLNVGNNSKYYNNQKITISGGTFVNWNPMSSDWAKVTSSHPAMIVLAEGYTVVSETQANGDVWYTVVKA